MLVSNAIEESFEGRYTYLYNLSVLAASDQLSFCFEDDEGRITGLRTYKTNNSDSRSNDVNLRSVQSILTSDTTLRLNFRTTKIGVFTPYYTLVPASLFDASCPEKYLEPLYSTPENITANFDYLPQLNAYTVYYIDSPLYSFAESFFNRPGIYHGVSGLLMQQLKHAENMQQQHIYVHLREQLAYVTVYSKSKLIFSNFFRFETAKDLLYFLLLVYSQLKLSPEKTPVLLSGEIMADSDIYRELYKYIRHVEFAQRPAYYRYGTMLSQFPAHLFQDLFSIKLCE